MNRIQEALSKRFQDHRGIWKFNWIDTEEIR